MACDVKEEEEEAVTSYVTEIEALSASVVFTLVSVTAHKLPIALALGWHWAVVLPEPNFSDHLDRFASPSPTRCSSSARGLLSFRPEVVKTLPSYRSPRQLDHDS